jgi:glycerol kinase
MRHVIAIDQGKTETTVLIVDEQQRVRGRGRCGLAQVFPQAGWVEHEPDEIWASVTGALAQALAGIDPTSIAAVGIANQRATFAIWDRASGRPVHRAIAVHDVRTADRCAELTATGGAARVRELTGLRISPSFSATKVGWLLRHVPGLAAAARSGTVAFGTVDSYLVSRLTGGAVHATDVTNAARTLMFDLEALRWSDELLELFGVPRAILPEVVASSGVCGHTRGVPGLPDGIPIAGIAGDQQAALFGHACFTPGSAHCTYGIGTYVLMNTGDHRVTPSSGLFTTVAWKLATGELCYALDGVASAAGGAVQWMCEGLELFDSADDLEARAAAVADSGGVIVVPAFAGLDSPHWRRDARALITGITRATTRGHVARAMLEAIALQNLDILRAMERESGRPLVALHVDGSGASHDRLMQFQSDVLGVEILRPEQVDSKALGAAFLAGLATGVWKDRDAIRAGRCEQRRFTPAADRGWVADHVARWSAAVAKA